MFYLSQFKSVENRGFLLICVSLVTRGGVREKGETEKKTNGSPSSISRPWFKWRESMYKINKLQGYNIQHREYSQYIIITVNRI